MRVGIALGSNLGDRAAHLQSAVTAIREFAESPVLVSRVYETEPVDCPPGSPSFLNAAVEIGWSGDIHELLTRLQEIEKTQGRPGIRPKNDPRTVDLDILYADDLVLETPDLVLPHPRLKNRAFVLLPLADITPERKLPRCVNTLAEIIKSIDSIDCKVSQVILH
jgi:2-amino-4-hydroxy-6-hydroxymethyldihydropteridine diphosphokinase